MDFTSENTAPVHPAIVDAVVKANTGFALNFEQEDWTRAMTATLRRVFGHDELAAFPVVTGTAANAVALGAMARPYEAILCHWDAHIETDEGGAPEMYTAGARQIGIPGGHGKVDPAALARFLRNSRFGNVHAVQPAVLSLTNLTEAGTAYSSGEVAELCALAHEYGLKVHMDGARFANALAARQEDAGRMSWRAGVDVLSLGTTKSGTFGAEVIVSFDPALAREIAFMRKRGGHFVPKSRFVSAQIGAYFQDDLWLANARHANHCARRLAQGLSTVRGIELVHPVDGNEVFAAMPDVVVEGLMKQGYRFHKNWRSDPVQHRFVLSWASDPEEVSRLVQDCARLAG